MPNILIIDDDSHISEMISENLRNEGYSVCAAYSGTEALMLLSKEKPDLILLDLMLPGLSGEELMPHIKDTPVIVVSAKANVSDKVGLLLGGAADYVTKPFDIDELLARITVQLRKKTAPENVLTYKSITLYADKLTVKLGDEPIRLTRTECAILKLLMREPETPVGKTTILDNISYDTPDCTERSLKQHISNMRKKLEAVSGKDYIEAVYGIGFKMRG
jgi:DNA-binding response OmpR family regulator